MRNGFGFKVETLIFKKAQKFAQQAEQYEEQFKTLTDEEIIEKHKELKNEGLNKKTIPLAMALFGEVSYRRNGMRPFGVQNTAAYVLFSGAVAEMKTGEGKTLVALITAYLSFINDQKAHVITVNDYLARRDAVFASETFSFLGIKVGFLASNNGNSMDKANIHESSDIIYASNTALGFDYLRSNIVKNWNEKIIKSIDKCFAIVDEVDSVLIDEAKSPLILSGEADSVDPEIYKSIYQIAKEMSGIIINRDENVKTSLSKMTDKKSEEYKDYHYVADRKIKKCHLTEKGYQEFEDKLIEYGLIENVEELYRQKINYTHILEVCISALSVYHNGVDYIIGKNQEGNPAVKLIDEGTGRVMEGKMLSNGLHQAIEIKEGVTISTESKTLAEITYQNLFKLYGKLSGMTGTAYEDKKELEDIYGLAVCRIPTRLPVIREDKEDVLFPDKETKMKYVIKKIIEVNKTGQPILVGTNSVNDSEEIAERLKAKGISCEVLNAKNHERESEIVAEAGRLGAITIATSMAGRGTDIILGGNLEHKLFKSEGNEERITQEHQIEQAKVREAGGLYVLGIERNKSRRVDDQLKGRSGRQGDPGVSSFYLSLDDDLFMIFAKSNMINKMKQFIFSDNDYVTGIGMLTKTIHRSQTTASRHESDMRLSLLKFDNVIDLQRRKFYELRDQLMLMEPDSIDISNGRYKSDIIPMLENEITVNLTPICQEFEYIGYMEEDEERRVISESIQESLGIDVDFDLLKSNIEQGKKRGQALFDTLITQINDKKDEIRSYNFYSLLRLEKLNVMDDMWVDLLEYSTDMKRSVHLRGYAQKKPEDEYKKETWDKFNRNILQSSTFMSLKSLLSR